MKLIIVSITILFFNWGCSTNVHSTDEKHQPKQLEIQNPTHYDHTTDYILGNKLQFSAFLDKYYDKMKKQKLPGLYSKIELINNFQEKNGIDGNFINWSLENLANYNSAFRIQRQYSTFGFHLINRGKNKTLIYMHDNLSPMMYLWEFALDLSSYFQDFNIIIVDNYKVNRSTVSYSTADLNNSFTVDFKKFIFDENLLNQKFYFNIVCHSTLLTYMFFDTQKDLYEKVIYYTPMVKKDKEDAVIDFSQVFNPNDSISFAELIYFYMIPNNRGARGFITPNISNVFNIHTEINLLKTYYEGIDISKHKNKYMIYPENELLLTPNSMGMNFFNQANARMLKGISHSDYYAVRKSRPIYFEELKKILEE